MLRRHTCASVEDLEVVVAFTRRAIDRKSVKVHTADNQQHNQAVLPIAAFSDDPDQKLTPCIITIGWEGQAGD